MKHAILRLIFWLLFFTVILSGCLNMTGRLLAVRGQMCEFDEHVSIQIDQSVGINLHEPILRESDIYFLMDAQPTSRTESAAGVSASYVFEQLQTNGDGQKILTGEEISVDFLFLPSDKGLRLSAVRTSEIPEEMIDAVYAALENSPAMAQEACKFSFNPLRKTVTLDIDRETLALLPARQAVVSWLGPSMLPANVDSKLVYEFQLKSEQAEPPVARVNVGYDQTGEHLLNVDATFTRYHANIDVPAGTISMRLN